MTQVSVQSVDLALTEDRDGRLVFMDGALVAVLVRLSDLHDGLSGSWFLEAAFGLMNVTEHPVFPTLDAAQAWVVQRANVPIYP